VTRLLETLDLLAGEFNNLDPQLQSFIAQLAVALPIITAVSGAVSTFLTPIGGLAVALGGIGAIAAANFGTLNTNIQTGSDEIERFGNLVNRSIQGAQDIIDGFVNAVQFGFRLIQPLISDVVGVFQNRFTPVLDAINDLILDVQFVLQTFGEGLRNFWSRFGDEITTGLEFFIDLIGTVFVNNLDIALTTIEAVAEILSGDFTEAFNSIGDLLERITTRNEETLEDWKPTIISLISDLISTGEQLFDDFKTAAVGAFEGLASDTLTFGRDAFEALLGLIKDLIVEGIAQFRFLENTVQNIFVGLFNSIITDAANGINAFIDTIVSGINEVIDTANSLVEQLPEDVREQAGISTIGDVEATDISAADFTVDEQTTDISTLRERAREDVNVVTEVTIEGTDEISELLEAKAETKAEETIENKERRTERNSGTTNNISR
jgi:phage-related protein